MEWAGVASSLRFGRHYLRQAAALEAGLDLLVDQRLGRRHEDHLAGREPAAEGVHAGGGEGRASSAPIRATKEMACEVEWTGPPHLFGPTGAAPKR